MRRFFARTFVIASFFALCWLGRPTTHSQEIPQIIQVPVPSQNPALAPATGEGPVPQGVEVQARGPVHEAFATPIGESKPTTPVSRKPPLPIDEMPPDEKPEGDMTWITGYWAWDDDRADYLWVSGCWRAKPQGKDWVPGYWREQGDQWQWVPGFWANAATKEAPHQQVTYYPEPPAPPQLAAPGLPPQEDMIYVPGYWQWFGSHYTWRAGYWTRGRPGYIYVASHYRWTPSGFVFVPGYWDLVVARRGVLYAPVIINPVVVVGGRFVYTPYYAVPDAFMMDALFIRPATCHYYFGDYYGPRYHSLGFESYVVYGRRHYDPIVSYQRWEYRRDPHWIDLQVNVVLARDSGRAPVPPRTLVQQTTVVNNVTNVTNVTNNNVTNNNVTKNVTNNNVTNNVAKTTLAPAKNVMAAQGIKAVPVDPAARAEIKASSQAVQQVASQQRQKSEVAAPGGQNLSKPRVATLTAPPTAPLPGGLGKGSPANGTGVGSNAKLPGATPPAFSNTLKSSDSAKGTSPAPSSANNINASKSLDAGKTSSPAIKAPIPSLDLSKKAPLPPPKSADSKKDDKKDHK